VGHQAEGRLRIPGCLRGIMMQLSLPPLRTYVEIASHPPPSHGVAYALSVRYSILMAPLALIPRSCL
jgi:hypothetical protein